jgi:hypothetical protein
VGTNVECEGSVRVNVEYEGVGTILMKIGGGLSRERSGGTGNDGNVGGRNVMMG